MGVQFLCPSCGQPIEIDSEWANRSVACPYCRHTVTAPSSSTYTPGESVPTAREVPGPERDSAAASSTNKLAVAALVLSLVWLAVYVAGSALLTPALREAFGENPTREELSKALEEMVDKGEFPGWLVGMFVFIVAMLSLWVAALVCAVLGLRRRRRRGLAAVAMGVLSLLLIFECAGAF